MIRDHLNVLINDLENSSKIEQKQSVFIMIWQEPLVNFA